MQYNNNANCKKSIYFAYTTLNIDSCVRKKHLYFDSIPINFYLSTCKKHPYFAGCLLYSAYWIYVTAILTAIYGRFRRALLNSYNTPLFVIQRIRINQKTENPLDLKLSQTAR